MYCILEQLGEKPLSCPPAMRMVITSRGGKNQRYLLRGDSEGYVMLWNVPDISMEDIKKIQLQNNSTIQGKFYL